MAEEQMATAEATIEPVGKGIKISEEVIKIIAGIAASEVDGVAGMSGGLVGGIAEMLGRKNLSRGVKVQVGEREAALDIFVIVQYGMNIPTVAQKIQENVRQAVESMTGLRVVEVNIHVQGVSFGSPDEGDKEGRVR